MSAEELVASRFRVIREVGRGGMGVVYEAIDELTGERVAVKRMLREDAGGVRFAREAELLAEIEHPGLVRYVAHGTTAEGNAYLAMEWLDGEDLAARLMHGALASADAVTLAMSVAQTLGALHARGVVHRDVKPSNIFLVGGRIEEPKLLDLGIARALVRGTVLTQTGVGLGTPGYMAPEQARGERVGARADVFSLACVLYECLAGWPPFRGEHVLAVLMKIVVEDPPRLDEIGRVSTPLAELVARMLSKQADARPEHGGAVRDALEDIRRLGSEVPAPRSVGVTAMERRVLSLVMTAGAPAADATVLFLERAAVEQRAHATIVERGGRLQVLANGAMVAMPARAAAPIDQAACAARCALALAELLGTVPIAVVTGLAVVAGQMPVGEAIDRAAGFVAPGAPHTAQIRIDEASAALLQAHFEIEGSGQERWLVREREIVDPARMLLGRPTPFVGRDKELASLLATLDECAGESVARVVLVTAPAGTGKSRLMRELLQAAAARHDGLDVWVARGDSLGAGSPLAMAGQVIRRAAAIHDADPAETTAAKLAARLGRFIPDDAATICEFLREIAGPPVAQAQASEALRAARQDPVAMGDATRTAWEKWLDAECAAGPRVIVLEDLHWGDRSTVQLVDAALRNVGDRPLFVVATARPEVHEVFPKLWAERDVTEMRLGAMSKTASARLVKEILGATVDEHRLRMILERAGGHPFLLEELIRAVAEGRANDELPDGVLGMVQLRLDALASDARRALRAASVLGGTFWRGGVAALLGGEDPGLVPALAELQGKELIAPQASSRIAGDVEYAFRHALVRDAAYAMLPEADRTAAHALAGEWLEAAGNHEALVLAQHYDRGQAAPQAIVWYQRAAEQALDGNDPSGAIQCAEHAIACGAGGEALGMLEWVCAEARYCRGELAQARQLAEAAASHLPEGSATWFHAVAALISAAGQAGDNDTAQVWAERAAALQAPSEAIEAQVVCLCQAINQLVWLYREDAVGPLGNRLEALVGGSPDRFGPLAAGWVHRIRFLRCFLTIRLGSARDHAAAAIAAFERAGASRLTCWMQLFNGVALAMFADTDRAFAEARAALATAERLDAGYIVRLARSLWSNMLAVSGRWVEAAEAMRQTAIALRDSPRLRAHSLWELSNAEMHLGLWQSAKEAALEAADLQPIDIFKAAGYATAACCACRMGEIDEARVLVGRAMELRNRATLIRVPGFEGVGIDGAFAQALAAVGEEESARAFLHLALAAIRTAVDDLTDPGERAALLACPYFRPTLELAEKLRVTL